MGSARGPGAGGSNRLGRRGACATLLLLLGAAPSVADTGAVAVAVSTAVARAIHNRPFGAGVGVPDWSPLVSVSDAFSDIVLMDSPIADLVPAGVVRGTGRAAGRAVEAAERADALRARAGAMVRDAAQQKQQQLRQLQQQQPSQRKKQAAAPQPSVSHLAAAASAARSGEATRAAASANGGRPAATSPTGYGLYGKLSALSSASGALVAPPPGVQVACFAAAAAGPARGGAGAPPALRPICSAVADASDGRFACKIPPGALAKAARAGLLDPVHCEAKSASDLIRAFVSAPFSAAINGSTALTPSNADPSLWALPRSAGTMLPGGWRVAPVRRCGATASPAGQCNALAGLAGRLAAAAAAGAGDAGDAVLRAAATGILAPAGGATAALAAKGKDESGGVIGWAIKMAGLSGSAKSGGGGGKSGSSAASSSSSPSSSLSLLASAAANPPAARPRASSPSSGSGWLEASFDGLCAAHACCTRDALAATLNGASSAAAAFARRSACDAELREALASLCREPSALVAAGQEVCAGVAEDVAAAAAQATVAAGRAARAAEQAAKAAADEARRVIEAKRAAEARVAAAAAAAEAEARAAASAAAAAAASAKKKRGFFG